MIFNSLEFFLFIPIVYLVYLSLNHRGQNIWLLLASYVFYGWWDPRFLFLIAISTAVDYLCGQLINKAPLRKSEIYIGLGYLLTAAVVFLGLMGDGGSILSLGILAAFLIGSLTLASTKLATIKEQSRKKIVLAVSMFTNLGLLAVFKYFNFFIESAETVLISAGIAKSSLVHLDIILPVGISFYTFQTMSYTIDIYRGKLKPCKNIVDFALFVAYFPQLVAGPIERATNLLPRIINPRTINWQQSTEGIGLIAYGLFKKVVIADGVSGAVLSIYATTGQVSWLDVVAATLLFTVQIYCDFSGYSDIARGTSKLLGIELMKNFNLPYFSRSPSEFWLRWHISLSSWLRDYLYISLGGNRGGISKTYRNLMLTMLLGGLWHGAAWNYVLWGLFHGVLLCAYRAIPQSAEKSSNRTFWSSHFSFIGSMCLFFIFTCYGWLLFRAESLSQIAHFSQILVSDFGNLDLSIKRPEFAALAGLPILLGFELTSYWRERNRHIDTIIKNDSLKLLTLRSLLYGLMLFIFVGALSTPPTEFIYFQF